MEAYPLQWPLGHPRTGYPQPSRFNLSLAESRDDLLRQIDLLGGSQVVISSNAVLRNDGLPKATQPRIQDTGVAVYFLYEGELVVFACDKWTKISDNIRAIGLTIDAIRGMDRWGVSQMLKRTFAGFKALPETATEPGWWTILGVMPTASWDDIRTAYKAKAKAHHPDAGGSAQAFAILQSAYETAKRECSVA